MRHRLIAILAIRVIGIYLLAAAIPGLIQAIAFAIYDGIILTTPQRTGWDRWINPVTAAVRLAIALLLMFRARALVSLVVSAKRGSCTHCGFDLGGHSGATVCPECGVLPDSPNAPDAEENRE